MYIHMNAKRTLNKTIGGNVHNHLSSFFQI